MASGMFCESCSSKGKTITATEECKDCNEQLCKECGEYHLGFKAFKSHQIAPIIEIPSLGKYCSLHKNEILKCYCTFHDALLCSLCFEDIHKHCETIMPIESFAKSVKTSLLLEHTLTVLDNSKQILKNCFQERNANIEDIEHSIALIQLEISSCKDNFIKRLDELEIGNIKELMTLKETILSEIENDKSEISDKIDKIEEKKNNVEILKKHGTNEQLFSVLKMYDPEIKTLKTDINDMVSKPKNIDLSFQQHSLPIESLGSILQTVRHSDVQFDSKIYDEGSVYPDLSKPLGKLIPEGHIVLKTEDIHFLTDIAVTSDNKILLCNCEEKYPKVYFYTDKYSYETELLFSSQPSGIAVIPGTEKAVVTLPDENSIQFINVVAVTKNEKSNFLGNKIHGVTASTENVFIGGENKVYVLDINGCPQRPIRISKIGRIFFMHFDDKRKTLLCNGGKKMCCVDLEGNILYQFKVKGGESGITVDWLGDVYVAGFFSHKVHRVSSDGTNKGAILTEKDGLFFPYAMTFNNKFDTLFIINQNNFTVSIFKTLS